MTADKAKEARFKMVQNLEKLQQTIVEKIAEWRIVEISEKIKKIKINKSILMADEENVRRI